MRNLKRKSIVSLFLVLFLVALPVASVSAAGDTLNDAIEHHLMDGKPVYEVGKFKIAGVEVDLGITRRVIVMWIVAALLIIFMSLAARRIAKNPYAIRSRWANFVEVMVQFVRKDVADPNMGHHGRGFHPFLLTLFFFILGCNLIGLTPSLGETIEFFGKLFGGGGGHAAGHHGPSLGDRIPSISPTGDISVTMSLASITFLLIWYAGFRHQGPLFIFKIVPRGVPALLAPLMWVIELISPLAKSFALTIRLLANMTAGHVVILALLGFIFQFQSYFVAFASVPGALAIYLLEIFVSFLQAFIFTLLSALFIGSAFHRH